MRAGCPAPVDEKREDAIGPVLGGVGQLPGEHYAIGATPCALLDLAEFDPVGPGIHYQLVQLLPFRGPCQQPFFGELVDAQPAGCLRVRLLGVGTQDFEVDAVTERQQGVVGAAPQVLTTLSRSYTPLLGQAFHGGGDVRCAVDEVVEGVGHGRRCAGRRCAWRAGARSQGPEARGQKMEIRKQKHWSRASGCWLLKSVCRFLVSVFFS